MVDGEPSESPAAEKAHTLAASEEEVRNAYMAELEKRERVRAGSIDDEPSESPLRRDAFRTPRCGGLSLGSGLGGICGIGMGIFFVCYAAANRQGVDEGCAPQYTWILTTGIVQLVIGCAVVVFSCCDCLMCCEDKYNREEDIRYDEKLKTYVFSEKKDTVPYPKLMDKCEVFNILHKIFVIPFVVCFSGVISLFFLGWLIYGCVVFWGGNSDVSGGFEKNNACYYLHSLGFVWCILSLICTGFAICSGPIYICYLALRCGVDPDIEAYKHSPEYAAKAAAEAAANEAYMHTPEYAAKAAAAAAANEQRKKRDMQEARENMIRKNMMIKKHEALRSPAPVVKWDPITGARIHNEVGYDPTGENDSYDDDI